MWDFAIEPGSPINDRQSPWANCAPDLPVRFVVASLFYGRGWALHRAAVTLLAADGGSGRGVRLIGLESVTAERYLLLGTGHETLDLLHERTAHPGAA